MFSSDVQEFMSPLVERFRFVRSNVWDNHFAALVRRECESVCTYIFVRDNRSGQGSVSCQVWVAPVDSPDDALDNLGVGYKIQLAETWKYDDTFLPDLLRRLENLVPHVEDLVNAVLFELEHPVKITQRFRSYQEERMLYHAAISAEAHIQERIFDPLWREANSVIVGTSTFPEFRKKCSEAASELLKIGWIDQELGTDKFSTHIAGQRSRLIGMSLSSQFYIETLAPYPRH